MTTVDDRERRIGQLSEEMLDAAARAESAEAALDLSQSDVRLTRVERDEARTQRDAFAAVIQKVRRFHVEWGGVEDASEVLDVAALWEDLDRILNPDAYDTETAESPVPEPVICPECRGGKCPNCTFTVPVGDGPEVRPCSCGVARHQDRA